jgi:hypothetical protein
MATVVQYVLEMEMGRPGSLFVLIHSPVMSVVQFCLVSFVFGCCICSSVNPLGCLSCLYHASCILLIRKNINT